MSGFEEYIPTVLATTQTAKAGTDIYKNLSDVGATTPQTPQLAPTSGISPDTFQPTALTAMAQLPQPEASSAESRLAIEDRLRRLFA